MNCNDINSIPKRIDDYINNHKRQNNSGKILIKKNYIFSREDFIIDDYFLCEIILLLTAISKNTKKYMMKINKINNEIKELWADVIYKYIEMNSIKEKDKSGMNIDLSEDKISKNNQLEKEKNSIFIVNEKNKKDIKEQNKIIERLKKQIEEIKKNKDDKIISLEKKIKEYEDEINKLNLTIKENENKLNKLKKLEEENFNSKEKLMKLVNENLVLKTYKEYKLKYESLISYQKTQDNKNQNSNMENITETKEKYLISLKNNVMIQKENER